MVCSFSQSQRGRHSGVPLQTMIPSHFGVVTVHHCWILLCISQSFLLPENLPLEETEFSFAVGAPSLELPEVTLETLDPPTILKGIACVLSCAVTFLDILLILVNTESHGVFVWLRQEADVELRIQAYIGCEEDGGKTIKGAGNEE